MDRKEKIDQINKENHETLIADASKYHQVFVQNPEGKKVLEEWTNQFVFGGFVPDTASAVQLAKAEARREFVCAIYSRISLIEGENK